jgi:signal transduction histidine kinase
MGGYTIKAEEIGNEAALMAIEYLKGKPIAELPPKLIYPEHLTLNYNTLKKHNVPVNNITNKSILINYNPTFWNLYKNIIITVSIILIIQFVLIILLFVQKKALRQSHAELKVAKQTAEESTQMKKAFLANMNHEIRTPLNAIVGFSNLLYEENLDEQEKKKYLDLLNLNSEMLLNMVSDLLDLSKIESGNLDIYPRKVAISKIIQEVFDTANLLRFEKEKSAVRFTLDIPETNVVYYVNTDTYRLKQILFNLIINTLKSMDGGNAKLGYKLSQESVSFFVENPKLRLDRKEKERIFEPFYRPMKAYTIFSNDSTVLANLSLIHKLANLLNGDLVVDDHEEGSIFYLTVPTTT